MKILEGTQTILIWKKRSLKQDKSDTKNKN